MAYQVIARRWRPQSFDDVVFQEHISRTIRNSIENGRISHAYLFAGPRGVGKTTSARILAKSLNCINGPTPDPCGVCENCVEIKEGRSFDVIEIDGASNNSVEDVRDLREKVNFSPVKSRYKIYIIDEVHMLSGSAFNALLKTLEEPPAHVVFIFATTEIHKLPDTILSRCQKYFFKKIPVEAIAAHLLKIVTKDGFAADEGALYAIARASGGSMRDAQSLLEQVLAYSKEKITEQDALSQLGIVPLQSYIKIFSSIAELSASGVIDEVTAVSSAGADLYRYAAGVSDIIRALRLIREGISVRESAGFSTDEMARLTELAGRFHDEELSSFYRISNFCMNDLRYVANERACIEMALLDMVALKKKPSLSEIISKLESAKTSSPVKPAVSSAAPVQPQMPAQTKNVEPKQEAKAAPAAVQNSSEDVPLPSDEEISSRTDYSEFEKEHPVVDKLKEMFHGEVLKKGE
jgi:DNA polymerase III subunit gamma/tau